MDACKCPAMLAFRRGGNEPVFGEGAGETRLYSVAVRKKGAGREFDTPALLFGISMMDLIPRVVGGRLG